MPIVSIHSGLIRHPKFAPLSHTAFRLWFHANAWCRDQLTDGVVPKTMVDQLGVTGLDASHISELLSIQPTCSNPLWHDAGDCYRMHDWLEWNDSKVEVQKARKSLRKRLKRYREKKRTCNAVTAAYPERYGNAPVPEGTPDSELRTSDNERTNVRTEGKPARLAALCRGPNLNHAFTGRVSVPDFLHVELRTKLTLPGEVDESKADATLRAWYLRVNTRVEASREAAPADECKFWRRAFDQEFAPATPPDKLGLSATEMSAELTRRAQAREAAKAGVR